MGYRNRGFERRLEEIMYLKSSDMRIKTAIDEDYRRFGCSSVVPIREIDSNLPVKGDRTTMAIMPAVSIDFFFFWWHFFKKRNK